MIARQVRDGKQVLIVTVFAGSHKGELSAFARHLHAKFRLAGEAQDVAGVRRQEDVQACQRLGVDYEHWDYKEAPYRQTAFGDFPYCSYQALRDVALEREKSLCIDTGNRINQFLVKHEQCEGVYFPFSVSQHIDHRILTSIGLALQTTEYPVYFYEEFPYVEGVGIDDATGRWQSKNVEVDVRIKAYAAAAYQTQLWGLGGSEKALEKRLWDYGSRIGAIKGKAVERYWFCDGDGKPILPEIRQLPYQWHIKDFDRFRESVCSFPNFPKNLQPGQGWLVDVGCGSGRFHHAVEKAGFCWLGFDIFKPHPPQSNFDFVSNVTGIPLPTSFSDGVVSWVMLSYLGDPREGLDEISRILKPGGLLVGCVEFLEPVHGQTHFGISGIGITHMLNESGYEDIQLSPGLNGFTLLLWTWLSRFMGKGWANLAFYITPLWLIPMSFGRFMLSWLKWRFFKGSAYGMEWVCNIAPMEFAGHVVFSARKGSKAR